MHSTEAVARSLRGEWIGTFGPDQTLLLTFGPDNKVTLRVDKDVDVGTYSVNWSRQPAHLDLDWRPGRAGGKMLTIVEFLDASHIRIEDNFGKPRPTRFSDVSLLFKKK